MLVKQVKIVQGDRWFYIEVHPLVGEPYRISSFTSEKCAQDYINENKIQVEPKQEEKV